VQVHNPKSDPHAAVVTLEYTLHRQALRVICDITGDNEARTGVLLPPIKEEKKFIVPFVIDDIKHHIVEAENLVIVHIVGKKHRLVFEKNK
jgi:hypothetical protein